MSGIYIPGMEMPKSCSACQFAGFGGAKAELDVCMFNGGNRPTRSPGRMATCPIIPVPDHGRLGDLDKLESGLRLMAKYQDGDRQQGILGCCETIRLAPTIIPASKEDMP